MINVLYVEDDFQSREVMQVIAESLEDPIALVIFEDSRKFEEQLAMLDPKPDVVFLDIHVRPLTGFQMLEIIRAHGDYSDTAVVALTASVMNEEVELLREAGFDGVVSKPLDFDTFPTLLTRILQGDRVWNVH